MSSFTTKLKFEKTNLKLKGRPLYKITEPFEYRVGSYSNPICTISVNNGFMSDFASIPRIFQFFFKPRGKYSKAAVVHDYLIEKLKVSREKVFTRKVADAIFYEGMLVLGVNKFTAYILFRSVSLFTTFKILQESFHNA